MRKETIGISFITVILLSSILTNVSIASPDPVVFMDPPTIIQPVGTTFDINVTVANVSDLYGWEFNVTFDPSILNCTGVEEGPFLAQAGFVWPLPTTIDNDAGFVFSGATLFPAPPTGASGNGTLATITFNVTANGASALHLSWSKLNTWDHINKVPVPISHTTIDGFFSTYDVAVTNVIPVEDHAYPTWTIPLNITVTVLNNATALVNFTVTAYYENVTAAYEIGAQNVTNLSGGSQLNLTFSWNLTDVGWGLYAVKANVTFSADIYTANNEFVYSSVTIKIPGDIQGDLGGTPGDGDVDRYDFGAFAQSYGYVWPNPSYNVECDLDRDGDVDRYDFGIFAGHYGLSTTKYP